MTRPRTLAGGSLRVASTDSPTNWAMLKEDICGVRAEGMEDLLSHVIGVGGKVPLHLDLSTSLLASVLANWPNSTVRCSRIMQHDLWMLPVRASS